MDSRIIIGLLRTLVIASLVSQALGGKVEKQVTDTIASKGKTTILVSFKDGNPAKVISELKTKRSFTSLNEKRDAMYKALKDTADSTQAAVTTAIKEELSSRTDKKIQTYQLWVSNQLVVQNADEGILQKLEGMTEISAITEDRRVAVPPPIDLKTDKSKQPPVDEPWGVTSIQAPEIWKTGITGKGVVVGLVINGMQKDHEAVSSNYRTDNGWYEPSSLTSTPYDKGYGTREGSIVIGKTKGIGVAPDAQWIACSPLDTSTPDPIMASELYLRICLQWMACPTDYKGLNPDCSKAPNLVLVTWGGVQTDFTLFIQQLHDLNIATIFPIGKMFEQPACGTVKAPGSYKITIGVGAIYSNNMEVQGISYRGPTNIPDLIKPDVVAPGAYILVASSTDGSSNYRTDFYIGAHGADMAAAHVAGLAALLYNAYPKVTVAQLQESIRKGVLPTNSTGGTCGGIPDTQFPNYHTGYGRVDALKLFDVAKSIMGAKKGGASELFLHLPLVFLFPLPYFLLPTHLHF